MAEVKSGYAPVEGGELYYEVSGAGFPLVLIHAGIANHTMWDEQVAVFKDYYTVIRYDTRGFGKTKTESVSFSNRQDLRDLLDHLNIAQAYVLGLSRGGQIALDFTLEFPEKVAALIPCAAGLGGFDYEPPAEEMKLFEEMEALEKKRDFAALTDLEVKLWVDGPNQPTDRVDSALRERVRGMIAANYSQHQDDNPTARPLDPPAAKRLTEVKVPTLVIWGDYDESACPVAGEAIVQGIVGAQKKIFPGVAHMISMEKPAEFNQVVLNFLQGINNAV